MLLFLDDASRVPLALGRWQRGLQRADLVGDLITGGPYTLIAPTDDAFDRLRWSFDQLIGDQELVESCVDLFEYTVIRGSFPADAALRRGSTLHGESIHIGDGTIIGPGNRGHIEASLRFRQFTVHATRTCVLPTAVLNALAATRTHER